MTRALLAHGDMVLVRWGRPLVRTVSRRRQGRIPPDRGTFCSGAGPAVRATMTEGGASGSATGETAMTAAAPAAPTSGRPASSPAR